MDTSSCEWRMNIRGSFIHSSVGEFPQYRNQLTNPCGWRIVALTPSSIRTLICADLRRLKEQHGAIRDYGAAWVPREVVASGPPGSAQLLLIHMWLLMHTYISSAGIWILVAIEWTLVTSVIMPGQWEEGRRRRANPGSPDLPAGITARIINLWENTRGAGLPGRSYSSSGTWLPPWLPIGQLYRGE